MTAVERPLYGSIYLHTGCCLRTHWLGLRTIDIVVTVVCSITFITDLCRVTIMARLLQIHHI